ncbi:MAG: RsmD family RNA methyltransferase [Flavobacteriaceae bacterium]
MNLSILHKDVQDFITKNLNADITKLILKGSPFTAVSIQEIANQIVSKKKSQFKLPTWFKAENIYYPNKLNIEQTSSEITAKYKSEIVKGNVLIDLTGGFGVDCLAFSKQFKTVTHCEIDAVLSQIVAHNYQALEVNNITTVSGDGIHFLKNNNQQFDVIYIDPSRRDEVKKRVFLLQDCLPNLPENLKSLFKYSKMILVKTAPLLDITAAVNELNFVKEIHIIAVNNDVKEVLYLLEYNYTGEIQYKTINFKKAIIETFDFIYKDEIANFSLPKKYLYEPNAAILKSGGFNAIATQLNMYKLHQHSHLYTTDVLLEFPGRRFKIAHTIPYNLKTLKRIINTSKANISIRNFPESVAKIRQRTKLKDGGDVYLFFTTNCNNEKVIVVCEKTLN